jgi:hypothetical protein
LTESTLRSHFGLVHDVVVVQRGEVHQSFERDAAEEIVLLPTPGGRRAVAEGSPPTGPQTLAAGVDRSGLHRGTRRR